MRKPVIGDFRRWGVLGYKKYFFVFIVCIFYPALQILNQHYKKNVEIRNVSEISGFRRLVDYMYKNGVKPCFLLFDLKKSKERLL